MKYRGDFSIANRGIGFFLLLSVITFSVWASLFQVDELVRARGEVIARERTQVVQVADGGVVDEIFVSEGDLVVEGQILAQLETERALAAVRETETQIEGLSVEATRARAEADGDVPDFSRYSSSVVDVVKAQSLLYQQNRAALASRISTVEESLALSRQEMNSLEELYKNGDIGRMALTKVENEVIKLKGEKKAIEDEFRVSALREVSDVAKEISTLRFRLDERRSKLNHTRITAPMDGVVTLLSINTLGGVLRVGDEFARISPTDGIYVVEAKVAPRDIGQLHDGLPVTLRLDAFDYSIFGGLDGTLRYISADTISEKSQDGSVDTFYRVQVDVPSDNQKNPLLDIDAAMKPGIPVTVDIITGKRSIMTFLLKPISRGFSGALTQR